jgi:transposase-like protein
MALMICSSANGLFPETGIEAYNDDESANIEIRQNKYLNNLIEQVC